MKQLTFLLSLFALTSAHADLFFEISVDGGGDMIVTTNLGDINAGGGVKFSGGLQDFIKDNLNYRISLGYLSSSINATNGDLDLKTITFDGGLVYIVEKHRFGSGLSYHLSPEYSEDVEGYTSFDTKFENAFGMTFEYAYSPNDEINFGIRYTLMDYVNDELSIDFDANSVGIFLSNGF